MKTFNEWLEDNGLVLENRPDWAVPVNNPSSQTKQFSLSSLAHKVSDPDWHSLYDIFARNPKNQELGRALYDAALHGNFSVLEPWRAKYLRATPVQPSPSQPSQFAKDYSVADRRGWAMPVK